MSRSPEVKTKSEDQEAGGNLTKAESRRHGLGPGQASNSELRSGQHCFHTTMHTR